MAQTEPVKPQVAQQVVVQERLSMAMPHSPLKQVLRQLFSPPGKPPQAIAGF
jgi:hypothetical protein